MNEDKDLILDILNDIFGKPKKSYHNKLQYGYNCPKCDEGSNKGNLEISLEKHLFHCWSCGDINDMHGTLSKLIKTYGTKEQLKIYKIFEPEEFKISSKEKTYLKFPEGFTRFKDSNPIYPIYKQAMKYLKSRGITDEMIEKFDIGFCGEGTHSNRIIIPSYDKRGDLNYYIARSWITYTKSKYKNPEVAKDEIIFFEGNINWDEDIHLCEGAFDAMFLPNSIAMLGKHMSDLLFNTLYEKANGDIVICLDSDAWEDAVKLYHNLNGGRLYGKIKIIKLTGNVDVADLRGDIKNYFYTIK